MANPIKGEVPLEVGGKVYTFQLGTYALAALERRMKMPWPKVFERARDGLMGIDDVLGIVLCGFLRHHRQMTEEQAADIIDEAGMTRINSMITEAIRLMQPEGGQQSGEPIPENPTKPGNGLGTNSYQIG